MKIILAALIFILISVPISAEVAPDAMTEFNKTCPAPRLCPDLEGSYQDCKEKPDSEVCEVFIKNLKVLSSVYDCQRPFDKTEKINYIVPAIWICGEKKRNGGVPYMESYFHLLSTLKSKSAIEYFASPLFRSTLDGYFAEDYFEKSKIIERNLQKQF